MQLSFFKQLNKKSQFTFLCQIVALFLHVQYIDYYLSEIVHVAKAVIIVISVNINLSTFYVVSHVLSTKVSHEWRLNLGFGTQEHNIHKIKLYLYSNFRVANKLISSS